jgi:hypothetical protein
MLIAVTRVSPLTGKVNTLNLDITMEEMMAWKAGKLIQDAFPRLSASEREFIKTGLTNDDWESMFREEDTDCDP